MHLKILGTTYHDSEITLLIQLRSMEWDAFPVFATRSFAPLALLWLQWWQLMLALALLSAIWCPLRNRIANPELSVAAAYVNMAVIALVANGLIATMFFVQGRVAAGCTAAAWQIITSALAFAYPPSEERPLESKFVSRIAGGRAAWLRHMTAE